MTCGGRYLAGDAPVRTFAAGETRQPMTLEVAWRSGKHSVVHGVQPNCLYEIDEAAAVQVTLSAKPTPPCLFEDVSASLSHRHLDPPYDDFARQKLLPRRLSQLGPAVAWFDLKGDGREDLVIGGGRGTSLGVFLNLGDGRWDRLGGAFTIHSVISTCAS
jgi:enediyne biosynthesis protein E4